MKMVENRFVRHKAQQLASCATDDRWFWSIAKVICPSFCRSSFLPINNSFGSLKYDPLDKAEVFAFRFA